jgi:hypothetical protein
MVGWMGTGVSRALGRKLSEVSRAGLDGKPFEASGAGVPGSPDIPPPLEYSVPTHEADGPVMPPEGQQIKGGRDNLARSVGVAAVVGINGVLGKDIRVLYPLVVFWAVPLPLYLLYPCQKKAGTGE